MPVEYVAYIDESGDPGVRAIKSGGSEWFILSCIVARVNRLPALGNTHASILSKFHTRNTDFIHFSNLNTTKKIIACHELAVTACRGFVVISNKRNIIGYKNPNISGNGIPLYWWLTRVLLEKVTDFCDRYSKENKIQSPKIRIVFSRRGGNDYDHLIQYLKYICVQSYTNRLHINTYDVKWPLIDFDEIQVVDSVHLVGLQFADILAGAFHQAFVKDDHEYSQILRKIVGQDAKRKRIGYGLKPFPWITDMPLTQRQLEIFRHYGYGR